ncbi:MAG: NHL repeat-containing protein [Planctomycetota bacterium]
MFGGLTIRNDCLFISRGSGRAEVQVVDCNNFSLRRTIPIGADAAGRASSAGIAISPTFTIGVADPISRLVRMVSAFGKSLGSIGNITTGEKREDSLPVAPDRRGELAEPAALCFDERGSVFVASAGGPRVHSVQKFTKTGRFLGSLRAFGVSGESFSSPRGIAIHREYLYIADTGSGLVQVYKTCGAFYQIFSTAVEHGETSSPVSLAFGPRGDLYLLDRGDAGAVKRFSPSGEFINRVISNKFIEAPISIACSPAGTLFILDQDGDRLRAFSQDGTLLADLIHVMNGESVVQSGGGVVYR